MPRTDLVLVVEKYRERGVEALWKCLGHGSEVSYCKSSASTSMTIVNDLDTTNAQSSSIYIDFK